MTIFTKLKEQELFDDAIAGRLDTKMFRVMVFLKNHLPTYMFKAVYGL